MLHVNFTAAPSACSDCHENPHADQFETKANDCGSCHNSNKWRPSLFDHEKTTFSLKGGHEDVACSACHTLKRPVNGTLVLFYKPTPRACADCHGDKIPKLNTLLDQQRQQFPKNVFRWGDFPWQSRGGVVVDYVLESTGHIETPTPGNSPTDVALHWSVAVTEKFPGFPAR